jgi:hypothetical protein
MLKKQLEKKLNEAQKRLSELLIELVETDSRNVAKVETLAYINNRMAEKYVCLEILEIIDETEDIDEIKKEIKKIERECINNIIAERNPQEYYREELAALREINIWVKW